MTKVDFLRPLQGIHCHNGYGHPLPTYESINSHWPSMGRKSEGLLRARLDTGESYTPLPAPLSNVLLAPDPRPRSVAADSAAHAPSYAFAASASATAAADDDAGIVPTVIEEIISTRERMRKVSCSDKLLKWNILGVQGALLANLLTEPIYVRSVIVGGKVFSHGAASRALCCRASSISMLPPPYRLNHPMIFHVSDDEIGGQQETPGHGGHKMSAMAWSWSSGDIFPEVIDCRNGRPVHALQFSMSQQQQDDLYGVSTLAAAAAADKSPSEDSVAAATTSTTAEVSTGRNGDYGDEEEDEQEPSSRHHSDVDMAVAPLAPEVAAAGSGNPNPNPDKQQQFLQEALGYVQRDSYSSHSLVHSRCI